MTMTTNMNTMTMTLRVVSKDAVEKLLRYDYTTHIKTVTQCTYFSIL